MSIKFKVDLDEDLFEEMFHFLESESVSGKGHQYATNAISQLGAAKNICTSLEKFFVNKFDEIPVAPKE